jgi:hypothetical protein
MSSTSRPAEINGRHRDTLLQIFQHPTSHNIEWHAVLSLLEALGTVDRRHDAQMAIRIGDETELLTQPKHKDIDVQMVVDLRRMLTAAGYGKTAETIEAEGKDG